MSSHTQEDGHGDNNTMNEMASSTGQKRALEEENNSTSLDKKESEKAGNASGETHTASTEANNATDASSGASTTKRRRRRRFFSGNTGANGSSNADEIPDDQLPPSSTLQQDISNLQAQILTVEKREDFTDAQKKRVTTQIKNAISTKQTLLERAKKKEAEHNPLLNADFSSLGEMAGMTGAVAKDALRRRIYLGNIYYEIKEPEIRSVFQPFGTITSVEMSNDPLTGKHKGYCFLEYDTPEAAETAISVMNGFELAGRKIRVGRPHIAPGSAVSQVPGFDINNVANTGGGAQPPQGSSGEAQAEQTQNSQASQTTEAATTATSAPTTSSSSGEDAAAQPVKAPAAASENKKVAEAASKAAKIAASFAAGGGSSGFGIQQNPNCRIYVGSVPFEMQAEHVQQIFEPFGKIVSCNMLPPLETTQPGQQHRGYGFIEYDNEESANTAIQTMNGFNIAGRQLKVNRATSPGNAVQTMGTGNFGGAYWPSYG